MSVHLVIPRSDSLIVYGLIHDDHFNNHLLVAKTHKIIAGDSDILWLSCNDLKLNTILGGSAAIYKLIK